MAEEKQPIDTGKKTVTGRTIWRDPKTGEDYSERSTTFQGKDGRYYTMPTVDESGNQYSEDAIKEYVDKYGAIDYLTGEELPKFKSEKDAIMYAIKRSDTRKQKEEPMEQQMELFARGGLRDEGGEVDEVSGNKVPIGGTKKGVRDDIDVNISEGEFVFPEDVTRYIGLEKLMQLRQEAKMGLKQMEAMGQMGNSEEATIPDDLPFDMADLIIVSGPAEDKPKEMNRGGVIEAQMGTFIPPNLQTNTMQNTNPNMATGIAGYQPSVYQQPLGQISAGPQVTPASAFKPSDITQTVGTTTGPQQTDTVSGFLPKFVDPESIQTTITTPDLNVLEAGDVSKTVKYINPETGEIRDIRTYNNVPTTQLPEGFIPYNEYLNQQETQPTQDTGVQTTQVTRQEDDDDDKQLLSKMRESQQRQSSKEFRNTLAKEDTSTEHKENLINLYLDNKKLLSATTGLSIIPGAGIVGLAGRFGAKNQENRIVESLNNNFGDAWKEDPRIKEYEETGLIGDVFKGAKGIVQDIGEGLKETFTSEGRQNFYNKYTSKYNVQDMGNVAGSGESYSKDAVTGVKSGDLNVREQQSFDNAVRDGNTAVANHHASIARLRAKQDDFIDRGLSDSEGLSMGLSATDIAQAKKYSGSLHRAVNEGEYAYQKNPFKAARKTSENDTAEDKVGDKTKDSCVIATHALQSGMFQNTDRENAVDWCKRTLHNKWWGETMRRGYRYLGRKHIANGTADTVYKEFKECIEWANGKRVFTLGVASRYYYRAIQTFVVGLFIKEEV